MTTNVPLSREHLPDEVPCSVSQDPFRLVDLISKHNSLIITESWVEGASTPVFSSQHQEDTSPHEMRLSPAGHHPSISWS